MNENQCYSTHVTRVQKVATILYTEGQSVVCSHATTHSSSAPQPLFFLIHLIFIPVDAVFLNLGYLQSLTQIGACCRHLVVRVRNAAEHGCSGSTFWHWDLTPCWAAFTAVPQYTRRLPMGCGLDTPATVYKILPTPVSQRCQVRFSVVSEYET